MRPRVSQYVIDDDGTYSDCVDSDTVGEDDQDESNLLTKQKSRGYGTQSELEGPPMESLPSPANVTAYLDTFQETSLLATVDRERDNQSDEPSHVDNL